IDRADTLDQRGWLFEARPFSPGKGSGARPRDHTRLSLVNPLRMSPPRVDIEHPMVRGDLEVDAVALEHDHRAGVVLNDYPQYLFRLNLPIFWVEGEHFLPGADFRIALQPLVGKHSRLLIVAGNLYKPSDVKFPGRIQQHLCPQDVCLYEGAGILDATIDVALSGEVDNGTNAALHDLADRGPVGDIAMHKAITWVPGQPGQIGQVAGVG